jgi:hypothetical protein
VIAAALIALTLTGPVGDLFQPHRSGSHLTLETTVIYPTTANVASNATQQFNGGGGDGAYTFTISTNNSGGSITSPGGLYTAGTTAGVDTVRISSGGMTADATVTVSTTVYNATLLAPTGCTSTLTVATGGAITFARASSATLETVSTYTTCASDEARVSGTLGTLIESASQNELLYSEVLSDASWTTSGTLTVTDNTHAGPDGTMVADTIQSTTNGAYIQSSAFTSTGLQLAGSFWCRSTSGSQTFDAKLWNITGATSFVNLTGATATTTWARYVLARSSNSTSTNSHAIRIYPGQTTGQGTLVCTAFQLENDRRNVTSYIKTTSSATARPRDAITFTTGVNGSQNFCVTFTNTPYLAGAWNAENSRHDMYFGIGTMGGAANTFNVYVEQGTGNIWAKNWDNAGNSRTYRLFDYFTANSTVDGSEHSISGCLVGATYPTLWFDGVQKTGGNQAGTGLGTMASVGTAAIANTAGLDGWMKNLAIKLGTTP